jgi:hypothetical protein
MSKEILLKRRICSGKIMLTCSCLRTKFFLEFLNLNLISLFGLTNFFLILGEESKSDSFKLKNIYILELFCFCECFKMDISKSNYNQVKKKDSD